MALGGGLFGKRLCHESRAFKNGISALLKEAQGSSLAPSSMSEYGEKSATWKWAPLSQPPSLQDHEK